MKILHVSNAYDGGGAENVFAHSLSALQGHGDVDTHLSACCVSLNKDTRYIPHLNLTSWTEHKFAGKLGYFYNRYNYQALLHYLKTEKPDVVHLHGFYAHLSPSIVHALSRAKRISNIAIVMTVHSYEFICANASAYDWNLNTPCTDCMGETFKTRIFYRNCDRRGWAYSWAKGIRYLIAGNLLKHHTIIDHFIAPSEFVRGTLLKEGIADKRVSLIRNPVMLPGEIVNHNKKNEVVYFGRFSPEKNVALLIEALARLVASAEFADVTLTLIGGGEDLPRLERLIEAKSLTRRVRIHPFQNQRGLIKLAGSSKVSVLPSNCLENAPLVIPESIFMGMLPVVSDLGGMKEMIEWLECGYAFRSEDVDSLAGALKTALADYPQAGETLKKAKEKIVRELGGECYARQLTDLYGSLNYGSLNPAHQT